MKKLAIDYGDKRIGIAISDPLGMLASPLTTIKRASPNTNAAPNADAAIDAILTLAAQHNADEILIGIPYLMSGRIGAQARITIDFADALEARAHIPITRVDERLSSVQAQRMLAQSTKRPAQTRPQTDAAAAAIMLQAHLDANTHNAY